MKTKNFILAVVTLFALAFATTCFASDNQLSSTQALAAKDAAIATAKTVVPEGSNFLGAKYDDGKYEILFQDPATLDYYDIDVLVATNTIKEYEIEGAASARSATVSKSEEEIKEIILAAYPEATNIFIEQDAELGMIKYEAKFTTTTSKVELDINPHTGAICKHEIKFF